MSFLASIMPAIVATRLDTIKLLRFN